MYSLPHDYLENLTPSYHDEASLIDSDVVHQPDVYRLADYLCRVTGRSTAIDIGCGNGRKLVNLVTAKKIGSGLRSQYRSCKKYLSGRSRLDFN